MKKNELENSLTYKYPNLANEWHPTKNEYIRPENIIHGSHLKVWWKCERGHEWINSPHSRVGNNSGCPYCSGLLAIKGETDLVTINPQLAKEWHPTKNGNLKPEDVKPSSGKKVWWLCKEGHEWERSVNGRANKGRCPYCSGRYAIKGKTDLKTVNPVLAKEWHPTKNGELKPEDLTIGSTKKVWWQCEKGHGWKSTINNRSSNKRGCPYCSGQVAIRGETDLKTTNPKLAKEWHPTKNERFVPEDFKAGSDKKIWWQCKKGHEWKISIKNRKKSGCPYCSGRYAIKGETDLATTYPELINEWDITKNGDLKVDKVTAMSSKRVWWQCEKGHSWNTRIADRTLKRRGCPYCSGRNTIKGETDLLSVNPELAKEWHPTKNKSLQPNDVTVMSNRKVWWLCEEGHEWRASISKRAKGNGCKVCRKNYRSNN